MRIAMLLSTPLPPREGIGFYAWNLACYLTRQGHRVHLITRGGASPTTREVVDGITVWRPAFLPLYPFHVHLHAIFVNKLIRRLEPEIDVFHVHSPLAPVISTVRPMVATFHSMVSNDVRETHVKGFYTLLMKLQAPVSYQLERGLLKAATQITVVSPHVAEDLQAYPDCTKPIKVLWNGVDAGLFSPWVDQGRSQRTILTVSRLAPGKGIEDLIHAAALVRLKNPSIQFIVAGEGPARASLEKLISELHIDQNIRLIGHVGSRDALVNLYRQASLFVLPSHHEGLPTVILEAMACGCPVIATRVGGISYLIEDGVNGNLVPPGNPRLLADRILDLYGNPARLQSFRERARQMIVDRFSWEVIGRQFVEQYEAIVNHGEAQRCRAISVQSA